MKIAILSDVHGSLPALQAVLAEIDTLDVNRITNVGDTLGGPLESAGTADLLISRGVPMIAGNRERQLLTLPPDKLNRSDACTASMFFCHGTPHSDLHFWLETVTNDFGQHGSSGVRAATQAEVLERLGSGHHLQASLTICGHTHIPCVVSVLGPTSGQNITIVNPGSVGLPACNDICPFRRHIETGSPHAGYAAADQTAAGWTFDLRCVMCDFESMVRLAESRDRTDWAVALRTGRMD